MMIYPLLIWVSMLGSDASKYCPGTVEASFRLQWSASDKVVSPNRKWSIVTDAALTRDENRTPVFIQSCESGAKLKLFMLSRDADVSWSPEGERILIINKPVANSYEVLFSDSLDAVVRANGRPLVALDEIIGRIIKSPIGKGRQIEFYLPQFVSWTPTGMVISVGGSTSSGSDGPMASYCYGLVFEGKMRRLLSSTELKARYNASCRLDP